MFTSAILTSLSFEIGSWFGFSLAKFGGRARTRDLLINGSRTHRAIPGLDSMVRRQTINATKSQRIVAARLAQLLRGVTNLRAFESAILWGVHNKWPGTPKEISAEVKLWL